MMIFEEVENCNMGQELMLPKSYLSIRERLQLLSPYLNVIDGW